MCICRKKLSTFCKTNDWKSPMNYVAKMYMEDVPREVYFEDVHLQMDTKLWGEEYNRHNPPKKVLYDLYSLCIIMQILVIYGQICQTVTLGKVVCGRSRHSNIWHKLFKAICKNIFLVKLQDHYAEPIL